MRFLNAAAVLLGSLSLASVAACNNEGSWPSVPPPSAPSEVQVGPAPTASSTSIPLGDPFDADLDASVVAGRVYCEIREDPAPCARFVVDIPHAATVVVWMDSSGDLPMFIQLGNLAIGPELALVSGRSPLSARARVEAGPLPFRIGAMPWGRRGAVVSYRVIATLEEP
jgi:hypothetical protein